MSVLSARASGLYRMSPVVLVALVVPSTLAPDIRPHCPFVFLRSSVGLPPFRAGSLRRRPGGSATVGTTSPRREPFIPQEQTPAGHTSADIPVRCHGVSAKEFLSQHGEKLGDLETATASPTPEDIKEFMARAASVKEDTKR